MYIVIVNFVVSFFNLTKVDLAGSLNFPLNAKTKDVTESVKVSKGDTRVRKLLQRQAISFPR